MGQELKEQYNRETGFEWTYDYVKYVEWLEVRIESLILTKTI